MTSYFEIDGLLRYRQLREYGNRRNINNINQLIIKLPLGFLINRIENKRQQSLQLLNRHVIL